MATKMFLTKQRYSRYTEIAQLVSSTKKLKGKYFLRYFYFLLLRQLFSSIILERAEAVVRRCSVKKVFLKILQNSQENTRARVSFLIKLQA